MFSAVAYEHFRLTMDSMPSLLYGRYARGYDNIYIYIHVHAGFTVLTPNRIEHFVYGWRYVHGTSPRLSQGGLVSTVRCPNRISMCTDLPISVRADV